MQLQEIKNIFHNELDEIYGKEEVNSFFYLIIEHYLKLERFILAIEPQLVVSKEEEQPLFKTLAKLKLHQPIQQILGTSHFMGIDFLVNQHVLIPRPETEELVGWVIEAYAVEENQSLNILDIGTGSGCIAISLAKRMNKANVYAIDISSKALQIAKENAKANETKITFLEEDIFNFETHLEFDIIVSNPPYVRDLEKEKMHNNVIQYEPHQALFVSDDNPLKYYKTIAEVAKKHLKVNGGLFLEINEFLSNETIALLNEHNFSEIELRKDIFEKDRMIRAKRSL